MTRSSDAREETAGTDPRILWIDPQALAYDKPAGLSTSGLSLDDPDCLQHRLIRRFGRMVWAVHQLDKDTSGVNLFALRREAVRPLHLRMKPPGGRKRYLALVHGRPAEDEFEIDAPIGFLDEERRRLGVAAAGKPATTRARVVARGPAHSLLEVELLTGRTHQVRIHLAHVGHPLVGEFWYRDRPCRLAPRQMLHARSLTLAAHGTDPARTIVAPLPADFAATARRLGVPLPVPT